MKKIIYFITLILLASSCEKIKDERSLPETARTFLSTHFPDAIFTHGERDRDNGTVTYDVELSNGVELEFDKSGDWTSIDCKFSLIPAGITSLLPEEITTYLTRNYPDFNIIQIEKEIGGYEIDINKATGEFYFSSDGRFISHNQD